MRFAVDVPNFGDFADPRVVADLARRAEDAGWDGHGAAPILLSGDGGPPPQPDAATVREIHAFLAGCRAAAGLGEEPFDLVMSGTTPARPAAAADLTGSLGQAGATWWAECLSGTWKAPDR